MEDYKKKYEGLIASLKKAKDDEMVCDDRFCVVIDDIVPELKESKDERMMNNLYSWMKEFGGAEEYTEKVYQWIKGLLEKQGEKKSTEWSQEDKKHIDSIISSLHAYQNCWPDSYCITQEINEDIDWLKSLKPQNKWKPTEEQLKAMEWEINNTSEGSWQRTEMQKLYDTLLQMQ